MTPLVEEMTTFIPKYNLFMNTLSAKNREALLKAVRARQIACDELTEAQLMEVITQALASGDIIRNVVVGSDAQSVIYMPYAECECLKSRIHHLENLLKLNGIEEMKEDEPL